MIDTALARTRWWLVAGSAAIVGLCGYCLVWLADQDQITRETGSVGFGALLVLSLSAFVVAIASRSVRGLSVALLLLVGSSLMCLGPMATWVHQGAAVDANLLRHDLVAVSLAVMVVGLVASAVAVVGLMAVWRRRPATRGR